jgi:hypothetical protein
MLSSEEGGKDKHNRPKKTIDTLPQKCCSFWDPFIGGREQPKKERVAHHVQIQRGGDVMKGECG